MLLAAVEDGVVVGTVQVVRADAENGQHRAEIVRLAVRGDRRGGGIGRALLEAASERAAARSAGALAVDARRNGSDRFYEAAGWSRLGELPLTRNGRTGRSSDRRFTSARCSRARDGKQWA